MQSNPYNEDTTYPDMIPPSPDEMPPKLIVAVGETVGREFNLVRFPMVIGRGVGTDIQLQSPTVSRSHARISKEMGKITVTDLGSTNGVYVNNFKVQNWVLGDGDSVRIGETIFLFRSERKNGLHAQQPPD
jgi:pSer/pThr/pTyr-binding forkhead associated (FHA) protein